MLLLRKTDYYIEFVLGILMLLSIPVLFFYGFLAGLFVMGCWQLFSAAINTNSFLTAGFSKQICTYWKWAGVVMAFLFLCIPLSELFKTDDVQVLGAIAVAGSIPIAIYYIIIYKKLIDHFELRQELSGIIKSHH
jgi:hypothetical protein